MKTKRMMRVAVMMTVMLWAAEGMACGQLGVPSTEEVYKSASLVFVGRVIKKRPLYIDFKSKKTSYEKPDSYKAEHPDMYEYEIKPDHVFKGSANDTIKALANAGPSCGISLTENQLYLIYAYTPSTMPNSLSIQSSKQIDEESISIVEEIIALEKLEKSNDR